LPEGVPTPDGPAESGAAQEPPEKLVLDASHARLGARELPHMRAWFVVFVLWMAAWGLLARWAFAGAEQDNPTAVRIWVYALMCFYLSLCNSFVPLPTAWIVFAAASPGLALCENPWLRVLLVAVGGSAGTVVANLNDYHLLAYLLHFGIGHRVRRTRRVGSTARRCVCCSWWRSFRFRWMSCAGWRCYGSIRAGGLRWPTLWGGGRGTRCLRGARSFCRWRCDRSCTSKSRLWRRRWWGA